jgi:glutathione S-transferase
VCSRVVTNNSSQVPVLETPDGPVFESNAIARYSM